MAKSAALNPTSMPFFPGGLRNTPDNEANGSIFNLGFSGQRAFHGQDRSSLSSNTMSTSSEYRSMRSTPSPSPHLERQNAVRQQSPSVLEADNPRQSPTLRQTDAQKIYPAVESRITREGSMFGTLGTLPEKDERSYVEEDDHLTRSGHQTPSSANFSAARQLPFQQLKQLPIEQSASFIPIALSSAGRTTSVSSFSSCSPVPSHESNNRATPVTESPIQNLEAQLRASPLIQDILDRIIRCEYVSREIQQDVSDLNRKVNVLIERAVSSSQPEFKDPFSPNSASLQPRPSLGNIAPNQAASSDDISSISDRLSTLTSSVGQLLALQTQQMQQQSLTSPDGRSSIIGLSNAPLEIAPNQMMAPSTPNHGAILGHTLPGRPDIRQSRQGSRMWSSGTLELPLRPSAQEVGNKRRSSGLVRRDSGGVFDPLGDPLSGGSPRDNGAVMTKWEQLNLAPELLRSLTKFGVGPPNKIQQRALPFLLKGADIIAQAPPTQERIAAYVIPAIQVAFATMSTRQTRGPIVILVSTTLDQATQAQRMIRDLGGPIGIKSALGVGTAPVNSELVQELRLLQQNIPHIICGTPQKLHALFTTPGGLSGSDVRFLVLDEVDQLIARNLHEFVFSIVKLLPLPRSRPAANPTSATNSSNSSSSSTFTPPFDQAGQPTPSALHNTGRRYSTAVSSPGPPGDPPTPTSGTPPNQASERQTALFSNTVPQDVLNLASAIQLREPVRVLVRRDGNASNSETNQGSRGLRQFYLYLAFQAGGRAEPKASAHSGGLGIIGSGRNTSSAETAQAREWKLDALADVLDDVEISHAVVHVGGMTALDSVVYKLASRGFEPISLHGDMNTVTRMAALNKFRNASTILRQTNMKVLVVYDVQLKTGETPHIPLVINYDLPKAVEEYSLRVAPAIASNYSRAGVVVNFVTATGGDVEMLRSIECFYKIKCPEVPMSLREVV